MAQQSERSRETPALHIFRRPDGQNVVGRGRDRARPALTDDPLVEVDFDDDGPESWRAEALCATTDPELFFLDNGSSYQAARRLCVSCPVREACLEDAMTFEASLAGRRYGMFGGTTPQQRSEIAAERAETSSIPARRAA